MSTKQNIVHQVHDTAMYLLYNSYLYHTNLWPKKGFKAGHGIGCNIKDCIYIGVNAYGILADPVIGRLGFKFWNTGVKREADQVKHIRIILDYAYLNNIFFEDEIKSEYCDLVWFKFTYIPASEKNGI